MRKRIVKHTHKSIGEVIVDIVYISGFLGLAIFTIYIGITS